MANISLKFNCATNDGSSVEAYATEHSVGERSVCIVFYSENGASEIVHLDESTAIKFAKTVRTEINKIKEV